MTAPALALGTAQLGMPYGVAGRADGISPAQAAQILRAAVELGIDYIDTAPAYGNAEILVGELLASTPRALTVRVCTKGPAAHTGDAVADSYRASVMRSCERLRVETIADLLVHSVSDLREAGTSLVDALEQLRAEGRVARLGASIYDPGDVEAVLRYPSLELTQLPFSVFNRSLVDSGAARRLRDAGHAIIARSILHQGLLTLMPPAAEAAVPGSGVWVERFGAVCDRHAVTPVAAAVGFAFERSGADRVLIGVDSVEQLHAIAALARDHFPRGLLADLDEELQGIPPEVGDPRRWPARVQSNANVQST